MLDLNTAVPSELKHPRFVARPLTTDIAAMDYHAYMASPDVIRVHSDGRWPVAGFTLADDLELVAQHQADHQSRRAFTFVLLTPGLTEALGCVYVNPLKEYVDRAQAAPRYVEGLPQASAMVTFWLRQDLQDGGLADAVVAAVNDWLLNEWPLEMHLFRILPDERSSRTALERLGVQQTHLPLRGKHRPYLWYRPIRNQTQDKVVEPRA